MKKLFILLFSLVMAGEMEVEGNLKVTDTLIVNNRDVITTIDSLLSLIAQLEQRIAQLESEMALIGGDLGYVDCDGVIGGNAVVDDCGICNGYNETMDACGECGGDAIEGDVCDSALSFDGDDDYISIDNSTMLNNTFSGYHPFTVSLWVYDLGDPSGQIFDKGYSPPSNSNPKTMMLYKQGTPAGITFLLFTSNYNRIETHAEEILVENDWTHIVASYDGSAGLKMYQNGEFFPSTFQYSDAYNGMHANSEPVHLGSRINEEGTPHHGYNGLIDNLSIFDRQLSDNEIQALFNNESNIDNIIGSWNFNSGVGDTLYDQSGNGNHGTIHGNPTWVERE